MELLWDSRSQRAIPTMLISQKADAFNRNGYCTSTNKHTLSLSFMSGESHDMSDDSHRH